MQTFVPYTDHLDSALLLDNKRLFKQLVEGKQILIALSDPGYGWQNHPAVKMWQGYDEFLASYLLTLADVWRARGCLRDSGGPYRETISDWLAIEYPHVALGCEEPLWWGGDIHLSHQRKLFWKKPDWYGPRLYGEHWERYILTEEPEYHWPV